MKPGEELPVIREWYELTTWLLPKISKFPRDQKFLLGDRLQSLLLDVLDLLIEAKFRRDRIGVLDQINIQLEKLRFLLRIHSGQKIAGGWGLVALSNVLARRSLVQFA